MLHQSYERAKNVLVTNRKDLDLIAHGLIEFETLSGGKGRRNRERRGFHVFFITITITITVTVTVTCLDTSTYHYHILLTRHILLNLLTPLFSTHLPSLPSPLPLPLSRRDRGSIGWNQAEHEGSPVPEILLQRLYPHTNRHTQNTSTDERDRSKHRIACCTHCLEERFSK